ncbi:MAG TPA: hypothetical protein VMO76_07835 [Candidatus Udaeobacter sp.]|jgi:hypothetical protein|nr:hypothetical protein [Candidatus Udaeobacter sp.]
MNTIASHYLCATPSAKRLPNNGFGIRALLIFLTMISLSPLALCQSQSSSQPSPSQPPSPAQPQQKDDSKADAAKKNEKEKPKAKKVYTEEDLSNMRGGVSVVGDSNPATNSNGHGSAGGLVPMSGQDEKYWSGKAKEILDEMTAIDHEIAKTKDEIKKYGADGFDATSRLGVVYVDNRASKVQGLEKRKSELEKKLDQLQEDGRKAGAAPEWFR